MNTNDMSSSSNNTTNPPPLSESDVDSESTDIVLLSSSPIPGTKSDDGSKLLTTNEPKRSGGSRLSDSVDSASAGLGLTPTPTPTTPTICHISLARSFAATYPSSPKRRRIAKPRARTSFHSPDYQRRHRSLLSELNQLSNGTSARKKLCHTLTPIASPNSNSNSSLDENQYCQCEHPTIRPRQLELGVHSDDIDIDIWADIRSRTHDSGILTNTDDRSVSIQPATNSNTRTHTPSPGHSLSPGSTYSKKSNPKSLTHTPQLRTERLSISDMWDNIRSLHRYRYYYSHDEDGDGGGPLCVPLEAVLPSPEERPCAKIFTSDGSFLGENFGCQFL